MIRAIVVDDEQLAIDLLCHYLNETSMVEVIGKFNNPLQALAAIEAGLEADVAFLDIDMPGLSGLELAASIRSNMEIVFVTAYNQYAIEAFDLNAISYLLKPVEYEKLLLGLRRLQLFLGNKRAATAKKLEVRAFGRVSYHCAGCECSIKWRTSKAEELLMYLLTKKSAQKWQIVETIFFDYDEEKAEKLLHTSVYYIKQQLKKLCGKGAISFANGYYTIDDTIIVAEFKNYFERLERIDNISADNLTTALELFHSYSGELFFEKQYYWCEELATKTQNLYCALAKALTGHYLSINEQNKALEIARHAASMATVNDTAAIVFFTTLYHCCDCAALESEWKKYCDYQAKEYDCRPSTTVEECYKKLLKAKSPDAQLLSAK